MWVGSFFGSNFRATGGCGSRHGAGVCQKGGLEVRSQCLLGLSCGKLVKETKERGAMAKGWPWQGAVMKGWLDSEG